MCDELADAFDECIDTIGNYGRCILKTPKYHSESDLKELLPFMIDLCDIRSKYLAAQNVFNDYVREIDASDEVDVEKVIERFKSDTTKTISKLSLGENNESYLQFKNTFWPEENLDDSEIATVSENINTVDPITKLTLTDPVKNIKCGHVYEKSSIFHLISKKKIVKCPIPGCVAADSVNKDDLIPDVALKRYLDKKDQY